MREEGKQCGTVSVLFSGTYETLEDLPMSGMHAIKGPYGDAGLFVYGEF